MNGSYRTSFYTWILSYIETDKLTDSYMESSRTGHEPESLRENFVLSRMHCRMTGTQGLSVTGSMDHLSDGKWLLFKRAGVLRSVQGCSDLCSDRG